MEPDRLDRVSKIYHQATHRMKSGDSSMSGRQIGPYAVGELIGSGGMGDVYRACDSRLGRDVAIKVLPQGFVADPVRRTRFEREARLLASLNHPNIAQIHGLEQTNGIQVLVMEWVPGETLSATIGHRAIPQERALAIARQIANAVDSARESGVLHRDLKPANIKVRPDGVVKVLDFGLAKTFIHPSTSSPGLSATELAPTVDGAILGTAPYMSPEQARGESVDRRTDIWAFGCVLYEILTGRPPFQGPTMSDVLAAILEREPDWNLVRAATHSHVRALLKRCLAKDPKHRLRDIGDAILELDSLEPGETAAARSPQSRTRERTWMTIAIVAVVVAAGAIAARFLETRPTPAPVSFTVAAPEQHAIAGFAMSPDGRQLAFVAASAGTRAVWVRALDSPVPRRLAGTEGVTSLAWSADARSIAFMESSSPAQKLKRIEVSGGSTQTLADFVGIVAAWNRNGTMLLTGRDGSLYTISEQGGSPVIAVRLDRSRQENFLSRPVFLPDGRRFLFQAFSQNAANHAFFLGSLDRPSRTHLLDGLTTAAYADGYLFYARDGTLMAQRFDERAARFSGEAIPAIDKLLMRERGVAAFSIAENGTLAYQTVGAATPETLAWFDT
jgi:hypothetical protein